MLAVNALDVDINGTPILRGIGLEINSGEIIGLIGRNGAGKTTFLRSVMGLLPIVDGSIYHNDRDLKEEPGYRRAHMGFGYMPEDRRLVPEMTAEQNILVPVWSTNISDHAARLEWIYKIIPECEKFRDMPATSLSGGQQKLVALARALMVGQTLLLLDEPYEGLAPVIVQEIERMLREVKSMGITTIIVEQNAVAALKLADHAIIIDTGEIVFSGTAQEVLDNQALREEYLAV